MEPRCRTSTRVRATPSVLAVFVAYTAFGGSSRRSAGVYVFGAFARTEHLAVMELRMLLCRRSFTMLSNWLRLCDTELARLGDRGILGVPISRLTLPLGTATMLRDGTSGDCVIMNDD